MFKNFKSKGGEQSGTITSYDESSGEYCLLYNIKGEDVVNLENEKTTVRLAKAYVKENSKWACHVCTFENASSKTKCGMCSGSKKR